MGWPQPGNVAELVAADVYPRAGGGLNASADDGEAAGAGADAGDWAGVGHMF